MPKTALTGAAVKAPPERIPADVHNRIVTKAMTRADALEKRMVDVLQPILEKAGRDAAARFRAHVTDHLTAAADGVTSTSTMIAVKPRPEEAAAIVLEDGTPPESLHVTLAYLGEVEGDLSAVLEALRPVAASVGPLAGVVGGAGFFASKGPTPAILLPDVPGLVELRVEVTEALVNADIAYGRDHGFAAHLTVAYIEDGAIVDPSGQDGVPADDPSGALLQPLHFDALLVVRGDVVVYELPLVGVPALTAAGSADWTAPFPDQVIDVDSLVAEIKAKTDPVRKAFVESVMTPALKEAGLSFDVTNPFAAKALASSGAKITNIAETTQLNAMRIIRAAHDNGLSIPQTATALQAGMSAASSVRATMIARTELAAAVNGGSLAATSIVADATGSSYLKRWLTAPGAPFPRHELYEGLDGQTVALDEYFDVGDSQLQYPGDPDGDPGESINCRCTLAYDDGAGEEEADADSPPDFEVGGSEASATAMASPGEVFDDVSVGGGPPVPGDVIARIKENGLDQPLDQALPTTTIGRDVFAAGRDTEALYKVGGQWTPERAELHDRIVAAHFDGKTVIPGTDEKTAYFTAGGGASGKSRAIFDVFGKDQPLSELGARPDTIYIDPDRIKAMLPEYDELKDANDLYAASGVHEESSELAKRITAEAYKRGYSVVLDTTGSSSKFLSKIEEAKALGYTTKITMFSTPTNEAIVRAMLRGDRSGRYVSITALKQAHKGASEGLSVWKDSKGIDDWRVYDGTQREPILVAEGGKGTKPVLWDEGKFNEILAKAHEGPLPPPTIPVTATTTLERLMPGATVQQVQDVAASRAAFYQRMADQNGLASAKEYREKFDAAIAAAVKAAPVRVRVTPDSLDSILGDGRFKSQFESKTSGGFFAPGFRADSERTMFGYEENLDPTLRPIYGYLGGSTEEATSGGVDQYGKLIVNLKNSVRDRTTFSLADSLGPGGRSELIPQPLVGAKMPSLAAEVSPLYGTDPLPRIDPSLERLSRAYAEAQIHGGLTVNDVAEVLLDENYLRAAEGEFTANVARLEGVVSGWESIVDEVGGRETMNPNDARLLQLEIAEKNLARYRDQLALVANEGETLRTRLEALGIPYRLLPGFRSLDG